MAEEIVNWVDEAIQREAIPKPLRTDTVKEFAAKFGIEEKQYWYQMSKKENQEKVLEIALNEAKKDAPEILVNLGDRAKKDNRAAELYLDYILKLAKNLDIKSDGKPLPLLNYVRDYNGNQESPEPK